MKYTKLLSALLFVLSLTGCTFKEEVYINENGSGKRTMLMDGSGLMAMIPADETKKEKAIDSTFTLKDIYAGKEDSIAKLPKEEQELLKRKGNTVVHLKMDLAAKQMAMTMTDEFKTVDELKQDNMSSMNSLGKMKGDKSSNNPFSGLGGFIKNPEMQYTYNNKKFTRKSAPLDGLSKAIVDNKMKKLGEDDSQKQMLKSVYDETTYSLVYHFPKRVKKISNANAVCSEDKKTVTLDCPFNDYLEHPEKFNLEVEFE